MNREKEEKRNEEKNKIVTNPRVVRLTLKSIIWIKQIFSPTLNR